MTSLTIEALPKQIDFLQSQAREVLYSGAYGAGKTRALCIKLLMRASVPGAREGLCRKHLITLKSTTLRTLLESDGHLPPVLPRGTYTHHKVDKIIRIKGGGEIVYFGLDDPDKIGSYNLSGCGIDEAVEISEDDYTQLRGRIRLDVGELSRQIYGACNPGAPSHFLAERFGLAMGHKPSDGCEAIQTKSEDNVFLPADYIENLKTFTGLRKARYVEGRWVGSEGLVYDRWDRSLFVKDRRKKWSRIVIGQDAGYTNPAVMLVAGVDEDDRIHVMHEWYKSRQLEAQVIDKARELAKKYNPENFVIDPSAAVLIAAMRDKGLPVKEANNEVFAGIQKVQQRLVVAGDGLPRLTVDPRCEETIREFETYEWMDGKDKPRKEYDHAMDALRYLVAYVDGGQRLDFRIIGAADRAANEEAAWTTI